MTKVEQVARALYRVSYAERTPWQATEWDELPGHNRAPFERYARAAIEAMREPTEGMYDAYQCEKLWREMNSKEVWRLWIDAALSEKEAQNASG